MICNKNAFFFAWEYEKKIVALLLNNWFEFWIWDAKNKHLKYWGIKNLESLVYVILCLGFILVNSE